MHRNDNLSFIAATDIHKGVALKLLSDGTVGAITDVEDPIVGWSMEDVHAGFPVSTRTMFEGVMDVAVASDIEDDLYPGRELSMSITDPGKMRDLTRNIIVETTTSVSDNGSDEVTLTVSGASWTADYYIGFRCYIRSGAHSDLSYRVIDNTVDTIKISVDDITGWTNPIDFRVFRPIMGYALGHYDVSNPNNTIIPALILRQFALTDRQ